LEKEERVHDRYFLLVKWTLDEGASMHKTASGVSEPDENGCEPGRPPGFSDRPASNPFPDLKNGSIKLQYWYKGEPPVPQKK
jgi:hypothetical protein